MKIKREKQLSIHSFQYCGNMHMAATYETFKFHLHTFFLKPMSASVFPPQLLEMENPFWFSVQSSVHCCLSQEEGAWL